MSIQQAKTQSAAPRFGRMDAALADVESAIHRSSDYLLSLQHPDGYWGGELEADAMLEADYIFLHTLLESGDPERLKRACTEMMRYQKEDGSWSLFPGGPGNTATDLGNFPQIIESIERRIFAPLPPDTIVMPGHGLDTTIGAEQPHLDEWVSRGW